MGFWDEVKTVLVAGLPALLDSGSDASDPTKISTGSDQTSSQYSEQSTPVESNSDIAGPLSSIKTEYLVYGGLALVAVLGLALVLRR